jgi:hypothetical protein
VRCCLITLAVVAACHPPDGSGTLVASSPKLVAPPPVDPSVPGAGYLAEVGDQLQPLWAQFLDDCRLRLPASHPLNHMTLAATAELAIDRKGRVVAVQLATSGNADFDAAVKGVLGDAALPAPPPDLQSDDDRVHVRWLFARDKRQAGPATAQVISVALALLPTVERMAAQGDLVRAARRITTAPANDPDREAATERVMIAALREAVGSADAAVRRAAFEAIGRAKVRSLADAVHASLATTTDLELRLAGLDAAAELGDGAVAPQLIAQLPHDLPEHERVALAETRTLAKIGHVDDAAAVLRAMLDGDGAQPHPIAVRALAFAPVPALANKLTKWFERGDARVRAAVCAALAGGPPAWPAILRGLRDPDATVRATCADAAAHQARAEPKPRVDADVVARLRDLARDRDAGVRAKAIVAAAAIGAGLKLAGDPAVEVRIALATVGGDDIVRTLVGDPDADVRAAAVATLAGRSSALAADKAGDPASQVRRASTQALPDGPALARLVGDDAPDVATAALVRLASLRGRATMTTPLLVRLAGGGTGSAERVRTALAWLLAH